MRFEACVGSRVDPDDSTSATINEVLVDKRDDSDQDVVIARASDGTWVADFTDAPELMVAYSAKALAERLWSDGQCPTGVVEALYRIGWLCLNRENLNLADEQGWRQRDLVA